MEPTKKSPAIDNAIKSIFGIDRQKNIRQNICVSCKNPANTFRDELSKK